MQGAVTGLIGGAVIMTGVMLLWNYLITPLYMGYPREAVAAMLAPVFLPFNLLKGFLNAGISLLLYKPVVGALRKAHLIEMSANPGSGKKRLNPGVVAIAAFLVITGVVMALVLADVI